MNGTLYGEAEGFFVLTLTEILTMNQALLEFHDAHFNNFSHCKSFVSKNSDIASNISLAVTVVFNGCESIISS
jgi:hypothetical protein